MLANSRVRIRCIAQIGLICCGAAAEPARLCRAGRAVRTHVYGLSGVITAQRCRLGSAAWVAADAGGERLGDPVARAGTRGPARASPESPARPSGPGAGVGDGPAPAGTATPSHAVARGS